MSDVATPTAGAFELLRPLARGGMGLIWQARHTGDGTRAAVKLLPRLGGLEAEAFLREAEAVAALDHPHVVAVFDVGVASDALAVQVGEPVTAGCPWLAMELADGDLHDFSQEGLPFRELHSVVFQVLDALAHVHARRFVHRDLKPGNVLRFGDGTWKLADFGIAHRLDDTREEEPAATGTLHYMAPEQIVEEWRDFGPWTDIYALGCMIFRLVCGTFPFAGETNIEVLKSHLYGGPAPFTPLLEMPAGFGDWLATCFRRTPEDRFRSAAEAAYALRTLGNAGGGVTPLPAPRLPTLPIDAAAWRTTQPRPPRRPRLQRRWPRPPVPDGWRTDLPLPDAPLNTGVGLIRVRRRLAGRTLERDLLWDALCAAAARGTPEAVLVTGPAGIGKSRLARWVAERAHEVCGAAILRTRHESGSPPGHGLARLLRRTLRSAGLQGRALGERVRTWLEARGMEDEAAAALITAELASSAGAADRDAALRQVLRALARPVVVLLDDVDLGPESARFARRLLDEVDLPVLLICTARTPVDPELADRVRTVALGPLDDGAQAELIRGLLGLEVGLARVLEERTAGHPGFAVRLVEELARTGQLQHTRGGLAAVRGADLALPTGVTEVWKHALARCPDDPGTLLELAAALGRVLEPSELETVSLAALSRGPTVLGLDALLGHRLLVADPDDGTLSFADAALHEVVERRAVLGGRWVRWNTACLDAVPEADPARRGRWLLAAGRPLDAYAPLLEAVVQAHDTSQHGAALALGADARVALAEGGVAADDPRWGWISLYASDSLVTLGRFALAAAQADQALAAGEGAGDAALEAQARSRIASLAAVHGRYDEAEAGFARAQAGFEALGDAVRAARVALRAADLHAQRSDLVAAAAALAPLIERLRDLRGPELRLQADIALVEQALGEVWLSQGRVADAVSLLERSARSFEEVGAVRPALISWLSVGRAHVSKRDAVAARPVIAHVARLASRVDAALRGDALQLRASAARLVGDLERAETLQRQVIALLSRGERRPRRVAVAWLNLSLQLLEDDRPDEALAAADTALAACAEVDATVGLAIGYAARAACCPPAQAAASLDLAEELLAETGYVDREVAAALERAARRLHGLGEAGVAERAATLAARQRSALAG